MERSQVPPWTYFSWKKSPRWYPTFLLDQTPVEAATPESLIAAKNAISICAPSHIWEYAKKISNPYELVYTYRDEHIPQSLSVQRPLSRSYFKMMEMLHLIGFTRSNRTLNTAHVCEGPGGFIEAIYDYSDKAGWRNRTTHAMTLRSTKPHIPGWRRAQQFMNRHREIRIEYGADNTGDILKRENRAAFRAAVPKPVHIFTADGGFDFTNNYLAQESSIYSLLLASIHVGFSVLARDGVFILKFFDCYGTATKQLVAWIATHFSRWTIYKPATSRPCNSEQYFIGNGFLGARDQDMAALEQLIDRNIFPERLFMEPIPESLDRDVNTIIDTFLERQISFLKVATVRAEAWSNSNPDPELLQQLWTSILKSSVDFVRQFSIIHIYPIPPIRCKFALPPQGSDTYST
jgi:23S rRNA U2552 (ribose-2'-O)-methylase RlmE/FtsJ